ncbi:hypothetical protein SGLAM104S_09727 [Streptomyces glaucescens]
MEAERAPQDRPHLEEAQCAGPQGPEPAAHAHHEPRWHVVVRDVGGPQSREHLDRQERVPARSVEQVPYPFADGCPECVTRELRDGRTGQGPQGHGDRREMAGRGGDDLLRRARRFPSAGQQPQHR